MIYEIEGKESSTNSSLDNFITLMAQLKNFEAEEGFNNTIIIQIDDWSYKETGRIDIWVELRKVDKNLVLNSRVQKVFYLNGKIHSCAQYRKILTA